MGSFIGSLTGLIAVAAIFGVPGIWLFSKSEIGRAVVERIRHGTHALADPQFLAELDDVRQQLAEVLDRLEFTERQLAALKPGSGGA
ncbi:MAG: hypothetical protein ACHQXA_02945 [Gemmatimonadales bacterium]